MKIKFRFNFLILIIVFALLALACQFTDQRKIAFAATDTCNLYNYMPVIDFPAGCENKHISIFQGVEVRMTGTHTIKSLTIDDATLTHASLVPGTDFNASTGVLTATGEDKKVDLIVTGDVILKNGGKIDVDGKGYPGGLQIHPDGYGVGGGGYVQFGEESKVGGKGGTHAGKGGGGYCWDNGRTDPTCPGYSYITVANNKAVYADQNSFYHGSGGGYAKQWDKPVANGGSGGGRIKLTITGNLSIWDNNSMITANGERGDTECFGCNDEVSIGGSGAGGSIIITATQINTDNGSKSLSVDGGYVCKNSVAELDNGLCTILPMISNTGKDGQIYSNVDPFNFKNIFANGGNAPSTKDTLPGGGGGGLIVIKTAATETAQRKISVYVEWQDRKETKSIELYNFAKDKTALTNGVTKSYTNSREQTFVFGPNSNNHLAVMDEKLNYYQLKQGTQNFGSDYPSYDYQDVISLNGVIYINSKSSIIKVDPQSFIKQIKSPAISDASYYITHLTADAVNNIIYAYVWASSTNGFIYKYDKDLNYLGSVQVNSLSGDAKKDRIAYNSLDGNIYLIAGTTANNFRKIRASDGAILKSTGVSLSDLLDLTIDISTGITRIIESTPNDTNNITVYDDQLTQTALYKAKTNDGRMVDATFIDWGLDYFVTADDGDSIGLYNKMDFSPVRYISNDANQRVITVKLNPGF